MLYDTKSANVVVSELKHQREACWIINRLFAGGAAGAADTSKEDNQSE
jgi:hypothetical protein